MISVDTLAHLDYIKLMWVLFAVFWLAVAGVSWVLFYHWYKYAQLHTFFNTLFQFVYLFGVIFLFFLSFFFMIKI